MTPAQQVGAHGLFITHALSAANHARELGAPIVPTIAAAQAALESRYGESRLAAEANNLFGVKAGKHWHGEVLELLTREWDAKAVGWYTVTARWRKYPTWEDCFADYGSIIGRLPWYADAVAAAKRGDASGFLAGLMAEAHGPGTADDEPGWATDPEYSAKVLAITMQWGLL